VALLINEGKLAERSHRIALAGHRETYKTEDRELLEAVEALFRDRAFCPRSWRRSSPGPKRRRSRSRRP